MREKSAGARFALLIVGLMAFCILAPTGAMAGEITLFAYDADGYKDGVTFEIFDNEGELVDTLESEDNGSASTSLSDGKYTVVAIEPGYYDKTREIQLDGNRTFYMGPLVRTNTYNIFGATVGTWAEWAIWTLWALIIGVFGIVFLLLAIYAKTGKFPWQR